MHKINTILLCRHLGCHILPLAALQPRDRLLGEEAMLHQILDILLPEGARRPCFRGRQHAAGTPRRGGGRLRRVAGHFEWWRVNWIYESAERATDGEEARRREQESKGTGSPLRAGPFPFQRGSDARATATPKIAQNSNRLSRNCPSRTRQGAGPQW